MLGQSQKYATHNVKKRKKVFKDILFVFDFFVPYLGQPRCLLHMRNRCPLGFNFIGLLSIYCFLFPEQYVDSNVLVPGPEVIKIILNSAEHEQEKSIIGLPEPEKLLNSLIFLCLRSF